MFSVILIKISPRNSLAPKVQEILTRYGEIIQTRIGLHEIGDERSSKSGLIILNIVHSKEDESSKLIEELNSFDGVESKKIEI